MFAGTLHVVIREMRSWLEDCDYTIEDGVSDRAIAREVERKYLGGTNRFAEDFVGVEISYPNPFHGAGTLAQRTGCGCAQCRY